MVSKRASIGIRNDLARVTGAICSLPIQQIIAPQLLWRCWFDHHDMVAAARLVNAHLKLVVDVAGEYSGEGATSQELIAAGYVGLMRAMCRVQIQTGPWTLRPTRAGGCAPPFSTASRRRIRR